MDEWYRTAGSFTTEHESAEAFDQMIAAYRQWWRVHREVPGRLTQPLPWQPADATVRIDRILEPTPALTELGWQHGPVGVELKRSGETYPAAQLLDYTRAVWGRQNRHLGFTLAWPMSATPKGPMESVCAHHRIGAVLVDHRRVALWSQQTLVVLTGGQIDIRWHPGSGQKAGHR